MTRDVSTRPTAPRGDPWLLGAIALTLLAGVAYYALFRDGATPFGAALESLGLTRSADGAGRLVDPSGGTLPSFLHALALTLAAYALAGGTRGAALSASSVLGVSLVAERLLGTFDPADLVALGLGALVAVALVRTRAALAPRPDRPSPRALRTVGALGLPALALVFASGTSIYCDDAREPGCSSYGGESAEPVYLSYEELRRSVALEPPRPLERIGRLYLYGERVFVNRRNEGVHVLDNADPTAPRNVAFVAIPGNTELAIRSNKLYADSYVDLVTIDLDDPSFPVVDREEDIYPYDAYQNVPDGVYLVGVDSTRGVVIGHE